MTDTLVRDLLVLLGVCFALAGSLVVYDRDWPWKWFEKHESRSPDGDGPSRIPCRIGAGQSEAAVKATAAPLSASGLEPDDSLTHRVYWTADRAARKQLRAIFTDPKIVHIDLHRRQR